jgi:hypothetical protein
MTEREVLPAAELLSTVTQPGLEVFYGYIPRLMRPVAQAYAADPAGFLEHHRQWREKRRAMPVNATNPAAGQKPGTSLGVLSVERFGETVK